MNELVFLEPNKKECVMEEKRVIETMTPEQVAGRLRAMGMKTSPDKIRNGLKQGVYPFGDFVMMGSSPSYTVYKKLFDSWVSERATERMDAT